MWRIRTHTHLCPASRAEEEGEEDHGEAGHDVVQHHVRHHQVEPGVIDHVAGGVLEGVSGHVAARGLVYMYDKKSMLNKIRRKYTGCFSVTIEEGFIQKRRQWSSLLLGG